MLYCIDIRCCHLNWRVFKDRDFRICVVCVIFWIIVRILCLNLRGCRLWSSGCNPLCYRNLAAIYYPTFYHFLGDSSSRLGLDLLSILEGRFASLSYRGLCSDRIMIKMNALLFFSGNLRSGFCLRPWDGGGCGWSDLRDRNGDRHKMVWIDFMFFVWMIVIGLWIVCSDVVISGWSFIFWGGSGGRGSRIYSVVFFDKFSICIFRTSPEYS